MNSPQTPIDALLAAVAAKQPTPGGGAVAALAGALAAAVGEMALNYSVGKKGLEPYQRDLAQAVHQLSAGRNLLLGLMVEDQLAFEASQSIRKQQPIDSVALEAATLTCIRVPQSIAATGASILEQAKRVAPFTNRWLLSDLAVCAELAMATVRCGVYNVRVNLADVTRDEDRAALARWCDDIVRRSTSLVREAIGAIWARIDSP